MPKKFYEIDPWANLSRKIFTRLPPWTNSNQTFLVDLA
jgi:hypothetical protein